MLEKTAKLVSFRKHKKVTKLSYIFYVKTSWLYIFFLKIQVSRADAGTYECRATNPLGESEPAEQEIVVHCKYILWNEFALPLDET